MPGLWLPLPNYLFRIVGFIQEPILQFELTKLNATAVNTSKER
jgi:hypothetical protein